MRNHSQRLVVADWDGLATEFESLITVANPPFPVADPTAVFYEVPDEIRNLAVLQFAYLSGDFGHIRDSYYQLTDDMAARLVAAAWALPAAIAMGDWQFYDDVDAFLTSAIRPEVPASVRSYAEFVIAVGSIGARSLDRVAHWIKSGDWSDLPPLIRFSAAEQSADYYEYLKQFEMMLRTAKMAHSLSAIVLPADRTSIVDINLRIRVALAYEHLGRYAEARTWMLGAMNVALPHGFIVPFAQKSASGGRIIEQLLKEHYPHLLGQYLRAAESITRNWVIFRLTMIRPTDAASTLVRALTNEELEMTYAAGLGKSNLEIAQAFHLAEGTVKNKMRLIYEKLGISSSRPRLELRQVLWGDE